MGIESNKAQQAWELSILSNDSMHVCVCAASYKYKRQDQEGQEDAYLYLWYTTEQPQVQIIYVQEENKISIFTYIILQ